MSGQFAAACLRSSNHVLTNPTFQTVVLGPNFCGGGNRPDLTILHKEARLIGTSFLLFGSRGSPTNWRSRKNAESGVSSNQLVDASCVMRTLSETA